MPNNTIILGMNGALEKVSLNTTSVYDSSSSELHIFLRDRHSIDDACTDLKAIAHPRLHLNNPLRLGGLFSGLVAGVVLLFGISIISVFGNVITESLRSIEFEKPYDLLIVSITLVAGSLILGFVPSMALGGEDNPIKSIFLSWFSPEKRASRIFSTIIRRVIKRKKIKKVIVWNGAVPDFSGRDNLIRVIFLLNIPAVLLIHSDERDKIDESWGEYSVSLGADVTRHNSIQSTNDEFLLLEKLCSIMGGKYRLPLLYVLLSSCLSRTNAWKPYDHVKNIDGIVCSVEFGSFLYKLMETTSSGNGSSINIFDRLIGRLRNDYGLVLYNTFTQSHVLTPLEVWLQALVANKDEISFLRADARIDFEDIIQTLQHKPSGLYIALLQTDNSERSRPGFTRLVQCFIHSSTRIGSYVGFSDIFDNEVFFHPHDCLGYTDGSDERISLLSGQSISTQVLLSGALEEIGLYDEAAMLLSTLSGYSGPLSSVKLARLQERQGRADDAVNSLNALSSLADTLYVKLIESETNKLIPCLTQTEAEFLINYLQQRAWIPYSSFLTCEKNTAEDCIKKSGDVLRLSINLERNSVLLWRQGNYNACIMEWNDAFDQAYKEHLKAAEMPGTPFKWKLASLTNAATCLRRSLTQQTYISSNKPALSKFIEAIDLLVTAEQGKRSLNDYDELPIVYHNMALTYIYAISLCSDEVSSSQAAQMIGHGLYVTLEGLRIVESTKTTRRKSILSLERLSLLEIKYGIYKLTLSDEELTDMKKLNDQRISLSENLNSGERQEYDNYCKLLTQITV